ncbi:BLUF domain-containing protein [Spongiibacter taiwanensis]|uniref:BLUF domain-containing protein n=1 Tax=Spongiibacter taiwanensis TaxID=1748242 RepID=UPI002035C80C|nr:BLUF domain-containing protein [Spongiibacter taiwanensis]USA43620.1 BLUF domain-containing protein [Spongiibacter taiwanensis]
MKAFVYFSNATQPLSDVDLKTLARQARTKNSVAGVTSYLFFWDNGVFLHYFEGPDEKVEDLMKRLANDNRHQIEFQLSQPNFTSRRFPDDSLAFHVGGTQKGIFRLEEVVKQQLEYCRDGIGRVERWSEKIWLNLDKIANITFAQPSEY